MQDADGEWNRPFKDKYKSQIAKADKYGASMVSVPDMSLKCFVRRQMCDMSKLGQIQCMPQVLQTKLARKLYHEDRRYSMSYFAIKMLRFIWVKMLNN